MINEIPYEAWNPHQNGHEPFMYDAETNTVHYLKGSGHHADIIKGMVESGTSWEDLAKGKFLEGEYLPDDDIVNYRTSDSQVPQELKDWAEGMYSPEMGHWGEEHKLGSHLKETAEKIWIRWVYNQLTGQVLFGSDPAGNWESHFELADKIGFPQEGDDASTDGKDSDRFYQYFWGGVIRILHGKYENECMYCPDNKSNDWPQVEALIDQEFGKQHLGSHKTASEGVKIAVLDDGTPIVDFVETHWDLMQNLMEKGISLDRIIALGDILKSGLDLNAQSKASQNFNPEDLLNSVNNVLKQKNLGQSQGFWHGYDGYDSYKLGSHKEADLGIAGIYDWIYHPDTGEVGFGTDGHFALAASMGTPYYASLKWYGGYFWPDRGKVSMHYYPTSDTSIRELGLAPPDIAEKVRQAFQQQKLGAIKLAMGLIGSFVYSNGELYYNDSSYHYRIFEDNPELFNDPNLVAGQVHDDQYMGDTHLEDCYQVLIQSDFLDEEFGFWNDPDVDQESDEEYAGYENEMVNRIENNAEKQTLMTNVCTALANYFQFPIKFKEKIFQPDENLRTSNIVQITEHAFWVLSNTNR